jgi:hypothetical protein
MRRLKMKRLLNLLMVVLAVGFIATSCSLVPKVSTAELEQIVQRDGVPFDVQSIPDEVLDRLASHRVVLVGETHFLREHRELMVELLRELHAQGFRQFLFEWTQVADWLLADFVQDGGLEPDWAPPLSIGGDMITAIRDFNRTLPEDEQIRVHGVDVTLQDYGSGESFMWSLGRLAQHLPDPGPLSSFLQGDYDSLESQTALLEALQAELKAGRSDLVASWGQNWYDSVVEMVEVELTSVSIRAIRDSNYDKSVRLREDAIKQLVDSRLRDFPHGTLINFGSTHAQKARLRGTEVEWLGDYLVHKSQAADGSVIVLEVSAAHIVSLPGSGIPDSDLAASPDNELLRVMNQTWPDQIVFLPLDDPLFSSGRIPMNFGEIYVGAPKRHYDVFVLLPQAHRVPSTG